MQPDFLRYSCQLSLPGFSVAAQQRLQAARVLVVGAGGLGCPAAQYLAAAGVGTLGIADADTVSVSNLHRQILYAPADAGQKKVQIAVQQLQRQNSGIRVIAHDLRINADNVADLLLDYDLLVDATDNFETRYLLNDACVLAGKPLVYGAIYQYEGQVAVWNVLNGDGTRSPHYRDLFPEADGAAVPDCTVGGVFPTLAGIIGCLMANEALKYLAGMDDLLAGRLLLFDARTLQSRIIRLGAASRVTVTSLPQTAAVPVINVSTLKQHPDAYELIDVRTEAERTEFQIGGRHLPLDALAAGKTMAPGDKPLVFYCASGKRSEAAVRIMQQRYPDAPLYSLAGGVKAWREQEGKQGNAGS